ncbi:MAG TPA: M20/M25/M40 family metallo-hydrolase [Sorangium sp.]|nr:M20/M25/M40 family metallo-hydrolase [Sorangium sp.]
MATSGRFGEHMRATMGSMTVVPNRINVVPSEVVCTLDVRNPDDDAMGAAEAELRRYLDEVAERLGVTITNQRTARTPRVVFDEEVLTTIEASMVARGLSHQRILSGAGHDAQELAAICPAGMIFVPGLYDGISHNPRELSTPQACAAGAQVLLDTVLKLANRP